MGQLLYIEASPRKKRSSSIEVAHTFLQAYKESNPKDEIKTFDLWKRELPSFDGDVIDAKYMVMKGVSPTDEQKKAWRAVELIIEEFKQADRYLFSIPMWNFSIPYKLKHFFDVIVQPSYTFSASEGAYKGLITQKPVVIIYARGGSYTPGTPAASLNFQQPYMELILKFIGFTDIRSVIVEPTASLPEEKEKAVERAKEEAIMIAKALSNK